ncbi:MAG TPA: hypothetical protein VMJ10_27085 [Kofleriaceae bacterium]|nr:hypothetical protein [Kofleriaceae bacterium]
MKQLLVLAAITCAGCLRADGAFHCSTSMDCVTSTSAGTCQATGYCSFPDGDCPNGRYGGLSGTLSNQCVSGMPADGGTIDSAPVAPSLVSSAYLAIQSGSPMEISFQLTVPDMPNRLLIVSAEMSSDATDTMPSVASVTYGSQQLTQLDVVTGCGPTSPDTMTQSEQWVLVAPQVSASATVDIMLASPAVTLHGNAMVFQGVNQQTPTRSVAHGSGNDSTSLIDVASTPYDLVESTTGHGGGIVGPAANSTQVFKDNGNGSTSLNNAAGSTTPGATGDAAVGWIYSDMDNWQTIAASLEPVP